jgi:regulator of sigma E protease
VIDSQTIDPASHLIVADVVPGSPAAAASIAAGDRILSIRDKNDDSPKTLAPDDVSAYVAKHNGQTLSLTYVRAGATSTVSVIPANAIIPHESSRPALGVALALVSTRPLSTGEAFSEGAASSWDALKRVVGSLWKLITQAVEGKADIAGVVGPIGLVSVIGDASQNGIGNVLALAAFISINLTVINLIPIPLLDGGRLALLAFEAILRREAPRVVVRLFNAIGVLLILILMITVTYNDILRLLA